MTPPSATATSSDGLDVLHSESQHTRYDSKISVSSNLTKSSIHSARSHQQYLDSLVPPSREELERIDKVQCVKEEAAIMKRLSVEDHDMTEEERRKAAAMIQRNYRGHRDRRMLEGMSLDPSTRWIEAVKEARYRSLTSPKARQSFGERPSTAEVDGSSHSMARQNWKKIGVIARRAGGDEDSEDNDTDDNENVDEEEREARRKARAEAKATRQKKSKMMDLQYFLEMVDLKHRYGSNLRTYHEEWKKAKTNENFFYWLDYGEGRYIEAAGCTRERLDREQVRYLSKEERLDYLVKIDKEGRLCWAKNGARIDTTEKWKDSIHGIVPDTDNTPAFAPIAEEAANSSDSESSVSDGEEHHDHHDHHAAQERQETARSNKYATPEFDKSRGMTKVKHVSAATIFNKLLRGSVKKNTWIFVADTSFRLYVGIKQSGAFQHSSFLHGSRISAAGLIKIKDGRLSKLSPLSGHYRPPVSNFRTFVHSMKEAGVDMSHVSISRSYAVLVGLEAYVKTRRRGKKLVKKLIHGRDKLLSPDEVAKKEEEDRDKSESAARERRFLEMKLEAEAEDKESHIASLKLMEKLRIKSNNKIAHPGGDMKRDADIEVPGTGPENAIAPEGTRNDL